MAQDGEVSLSVIEVEDSRVRAHQNAYNPRTDARGVGANKVAVVDVEAFGTLSPQDAQRRGA